MFKSSDGMRSRAPFAQASIAVIVSMMYRQFTRIISHVSISKQSTTRVV